jgi:regulator of RNase E activity RraA
MGLQERYQMDPAMRPLYFGIRFAGIAHTAEYDDIDRPLEDQVLVIDAKRTAAGILGSANTLQGRIKGVVGFVIDGTCRDSYECVIQKTPVFCTVRSPAHPMGRIGPISNNQPITCAGVKVRPGDVIVADDDGIMVVPQGIADEVARRAKLIQDKDRPGRRENYKKLGLPLDETVQ